jgi:putative tryptophan/tyrosine transport system substrate-binding protein
VPVVAKRLDVLLKLVPKAQVIALLVNPTNPFGEAEAKELQAAVRSLKLELKIIQAKSAPEIEGAFATLIAQRAGAVLLGGDAFFLIQSGQIAGLAARYGVPAISNFLEFPSTGGLMSYGDDLIEDYRLTGSYVGRILRGERPADLPVTQPTKFEFVINLKTANALGLSVPPTLLALADEVIE